MYYNIHCLYLEYVHSVENKIFNHKNYKRTLMLAYRKSFRSLLDKNLSSIWPYSCEFKLCY